MIFIPCLLACSGPGAIVAIKQSIAFGYFCAGVGGVVTLALIYDSLRTRRFSHFIPIAVLLLLLHPAWTVSAVQGDCGSQKCFTSFCFTAVYAGIFCFQHFLFKGRRVV